MSARSHTQRADVVIVGGGPAGSAAAITAAQLGLRAILLERTPTPRERVGESLHPGVEPVFQALGVSTDVEGADFVRHRGHWRVSAAGERAWMPFGRDARGEWRGYQAWRSTLDAILQRGAERAGADVRRGVAARSVLGRRERVLGVATTGGALHADVVIDAAGDTHWMARQLGVAPRAASRRLVASYGYARPRDDGRFDEPSFEADRDGWTWLARVRPGVIQWTRLDADGAMRRARPAPLREAVPLGAPRGADVTWRIARTLAGTGWLTAGDGAWVLDPSSSHGVLKALLSGIAAARVAASIVASPASASAAARRYASWIARWFESDRRELRRRTSVTRVSVTHSVSTTTAVV